MQILKASRLTWEDLNSSFDLNFTREIDFFPEGNEPTTQQLSQEEKKLLKDLEDGYFNLSTQANLAESAVRMAIVDPLLFVGKFFLPPYKVKTEEAIAISTEEENVVIQGRIDVLVLRDAFWVLVIESKQTIYSVDVGLPQILAYMSAAPQKNQGVFGLITNGGEFLFVKLQGKQYGTSRLFSLRNPGDLEQVFVILKKLC